MAEPMRIGEGVSGVYGPYYTQQEVADMFGVHHDTIVYWRQRGKLGAVRLGHRTLRIPQSEIDRITNQIERGTFHAKGCPRIDPATTPARLAARVRAAVEAAGGAGDEDCDG